MTGWSNLLKKSQKDTGLEKNGPGPFWIFILYFFIFLLLFLPYPIEKSLPGNCDTWLAVALSNTYLKNILTFFNEGEVFRALYPVKNIFSFGESSPGLGLLFIFCKIIFSNDLWAYFLYLVIQFSLTSFAFFLFADLFVKHRWASFIGALFFCTSHFAFSNIDDTLIIFYFFPFLSLYFLHKSFKRLNKSEFIISALLLGITPYFSFYLYFYLLIILFTTFFFYKDEINKLGIVFFLSSLFISFIISSPLIFFYLQNSSNPDFVNPYNLPMVIKSTSLQGGDFFKALPNNLMEIKSHKLNNQDPFWALLRRHAWMGITLPFLSLFGWFFNNDKRISRTIICIFLLGLLLSLGPSIFIFGFKIPSPVAILYEWVPLSSFLRVPLRAFFITLISLCFFACFSFKFIFELGEKSKILSAFLLILFMSGYFIENIPYPLKKYPTFSLEKPPSYYERIDKVYRPQVLLNLPSLIRFDFLDSENDLYSFNREILYMNWQTKLSHNIVNGVNGYIPKKRLQLQSLLYNLKSLSSLGQLKKMGIDMILIHKNLLKGVEEKKYFSFNLLKGAKVIENEKSHMLLAL